MLGNSAENIKIYHRRVQISKLLRPAPHYRLLRGSVFYENLPIQKPHLAMRCLYW